MKIFLTPDPAFVKVKGGKPACTHDSLEYLLGAPPFFMYSGAVVAEFL